MRLIIIGCEYVGKTTLAGGITTWLAQTLGGASMGWHDHFVLPYIENPGPDSEEDAEQILTLRPALREKLQRYMIQYHFHPEFYLDNHHLLVNWYYADAVYAPLYYGYGGPGQYADRWRLARSWDREVMEVAPDTVLVLMKASPDVIRARRRENPHRHCILQDADVERVLERFQEQYNASLLRRRFILDTTETSVAETLDEFVRRVEPHLTSADQLRILSHQALGPGQP
ncbi:MAG: hypothetical protein ACREOS_03440 [Candidatus Dormibacteraceae bacterium]